MSFDLLAYENYFRGCRNTESPLMYIRKRLMYFVPLRGLSYNSPNKDFVSVYIETESYRAGAGVSRRTEDIFCDIV